MRDGCYNEWAVTNRVVTQAHARSSKGCENSTSEIKCEYMGVASASERRRQEKVGSRKIMRGDLRSLMVQLLLGMFRRHNTRVLMMRVVHANSSNMSSQLLGPLYAYDLFAHDHGNRSQNTARRHSSAQHRPLSHFLHLRGYSTLTIHTQTQEKTRTYTSYACVTYHEPMHQEAYSPSKKRVVKDT
jgi:hypothetical protein